MSSYHDHPELLPLEQCSEPGAANVRIVGRSLVRKCVFVTCLLNKRSYSERQHQHLLAERAGFATFSSADSLRLPVNESLARCKTA